MQSIFLRRSAYIIDQNLLGESGEEMNLGVNDVLDASWCGQMAAIGFREPNTRLNCFGSSAHRKPRTPHGFHRLASRHCRAGQHAAKRLPVDGIPITRRPRPARFRSSLLYLGCVSGFHYAEGRARSPDLDLSRTCRSPLHVGLHVWDLVVPAEFTCATLNSLSAAGHAARATGNRMRAVVP